MSYNVSKLCKTLTHTSEKKQQNMNYEMYILLKISFKCFTPRRAHSIMTENDTKIITDICTIYIIDIISQYD